MSLRNCLSGVLPVVMLRSSLHRATFTANVEANIIVQFSSVGIKN
jgi:hypothetical protein